jgi:hypothetical protein
MAEVSSARIAERLRGLVKAQHSAELKEALRLWAAEFNRKAKGRTKHARREKVGSSRREPPAT